MTTRKKKSTKPTLGRFKIAGISSGIVYVLNNFEITSKKQLIDELVKYFSKYTRASIEKILSGYKTLSQIKRTFGPMEFVPKKYGGSLVTRRKKAATIKKNITEQQIKNLEKARAAIKNITIRTPENARGLIRQIQKERKIVITKVPSISYYRKVYVPENGENYLDYIRFAVDNPTAKTGILYRAKRR